MEYNNIPRTGKWGDAATSIEENFLKSGIEIEKLKNANIRFKGYFQTIEALQTQHPIPTVGFTAWVGSPFPGTVYACQVDGEWMDTEDIPDTGSIALNGYLTTSDVVPSLESEDETKPLAASMGKALDQNKVDKVEGSRLISEEEALNLSKFATKADHGYEEGETMKTLKEVEDSVVQVRSDLNGKVNTTDIEQVRSQATDKVPASKLFDAELTALSTEIETKVSLLDDELTALSTEIETKVSELLAATVYISANDYQMLIDNELVDPDVEYNIYEE